MDVDPTAAFDIAERSGFLAEQAAIVASPEAIAERADTLAEQAYVLAAQAAAIASPEAIAEHAGALAEQASFLADQAGALSKPSGAEPLHALVTSVISTLGTLGETVSNNLPLDDPHSTLGRALASLRASFFALRTALALHLASAGSAIAALPQSVAPMKEPALSSLSSLYITLSAYTASLTTALSPHLHRLPHILYAITTLSTLLRTIHYILLRRRGLTGPAHAARLMKFWCIHGFLYTLHTFLSPHLSLISLSPLSLLLLALALILLSLGPRLNLASRAYSNLLAPFYTTHKPEIEARLSVLAVKRAEFDTNAQAAATAALQYVSVAGVSGAGRTLTRALADAVAAEVAEARAGVSAEQRLASRAAAGREPVKEPGIADDMPERRKSKSFFAGQAGERADATKEESSGIVSAGHVSRLAVRPAYEGSRKMREEFRRRSSGRRDSLLGSERG